MIKDKKDANQGKETINTFKGDADSNKTERRDFGYYSKKLNKPFDTLSELVKAEQAEEERLAAKEKAVSERKLDAKKVEDAYKALTEATHTRHNRIEAARKAYLQEQAVLKKNYEAQLMEIDKGVTVAEEAYNKALKEFTSKHGDFHATFRDGDSTINLSYSSKGSDVARDFWDEFFSILERF